MTQGRPGNPNWVKGVSGNPGGRPRAAPDVQELARQHTPTAIAALVAALSKPRERVPAAVALLDRGWGKPMQPVSGEDGHSSAVQHLLAAKLVSRELVLELASQPAPATAQPTRQKVVDLTLISPPTE